MATRLTTIDFDGAMVRLAPEHELSESSNTFTVIVGKNGIGKSRLLSELTNMSIALEYHSKVIAVSTSPFDKFPSSRRRNGIANRIYRYVGMRSDGIYQSSSAISLISSASKGLLEKLSDGNGTHDLQAVFESLNFYPVISFVLKPGYLKSRHNSYDVSRVEGSSLAIELRRLDREYGIQIDERYYDLLENLPLGRRLEVLESIVKINEVLQERRALELKAHFSVSALSIDGYEADVSYVRAIIVLMDVGLVRLMDLRLQKKDFGELSLKKASSGEQCLLVLMLGIAGHITDGALVLIDEPEISLHPRWQEEFMVLLTTSFSGYRGCQFIVATHSPQVISRLKGPGCYIASLSRRELYRAEEFHDKSADFQLAELFDAPGIMNEYISRLAFNLLAKVKYSKKMDDASRDELSRLLEFNRQLEQNDPVKELIHSVATLCETYADTQ